MSTPPAFGSYRVLHQIGSGVLGPVFRCYGVGQPPDLLSGSDDRLFAIKAIKVDLVPEDAARLADALGSLADRPDIDAAIVTPIDAGVEGTVPFLVYEYESGDALDVFLRQSGGLTLAQARPLIASLARAIDSAWDHGVGHGALHPRDVFVGSDLADVRVSGFGVAQALESIGAKAPSRRPYSAPERRAGGFWDRRADIYSFGAIVQELLARHAADDESARDAMAAAMSESPEDRPARAGEFVDRLFADVTLARTIEVIPAAKPPAPAPAPVELGPAPLIDQIRPAAVSERAPLFDFSTKPRREPIETASVPASFPWAATVAVAVAGIALGLVGGYELGYRRARGSTPLQTSVGATASAPSVVPVPSPVTPITEPPLEPPPTPSPSAPPKANPTPSPIPSAPQKVSPAPASARKTPSSRAATSLGALDVDSRPRGATVSVDGRSVGVTPLRVPELSPGVHSVLIQLAGHRTISHKVSVAAGEQQRVAVTLERIALPRPPGY